MTSSGELELAGVLCEAREQDGGERTSAFQQFVGAGDELGELVSLTAEGAQRVGDVQGGAGALDAVPDDIDDCDVQATVAQDQPVVEVAAGG